MFHLRSAQRRGKCTRSNNVAVRLDRLSFVKGTGKILLHYILELLQHIKITFMKTAQFTDLYFKNN